MLSRHNPVALQKSFSSDYYYYYYSVIVKLKNINVKLIITKTQTRIICLNCEIVLKIIGNYGTSFKLGQCVTLSESIVVRNLLGLSLIMYNEIDFTVQYFVSSAVWTPNYKLNPSLYFQHSNIFHSIFYLSGSEY